MINNKLIGTLSINYTNKITEMLFAKTMNKLIRKVGSCKKKNNTYLNNQMKTKINFLAFCLHKVKDVYFIRNN